MGVDELAAVEREEECVVYGRGRVSKVQEEVSGHVVEAAVHLAHHHVAQPVRHTAHKAREVLLAVGVEEPRGGGREGEGEEGEGEKEREEREESRGSGHLKENAKKTKGQYP